MGAGSNFLVEFTAESILQCDVKSITTPPPTGPGGTPFPVSFDPTTTSAVTLSGGNLVATNTGTTSTSQGVSVAASSGKITGKFYFECRITAYTGGAGVGFGVGTTTATYANLSTNGTGGDMCFVVGHTGSGTIFAPGGNTGLSLGALSNGDVVGVAVDLINRRLWFRKGASGFWNGQSSGDPTDGSGIHGGATIPAGTIVPICTFGSGPAGAAGVANNVITANFGASAFTGAVPSGYTAGWPA